MTLTKDPFVILKKDHDKFKALLKKLDDTTERAKKTRLDVFTELKDSVVEHSRLEEMHLYPELEKHKKTHELTMEGEQEHHVVDILLKELSKMDVTLEEWTAKLSVLKENLEHHIKEEEQTLFPDGKKAIKEERLEEIAALILAGREINAD